MVILTEITEGLTQLSLHHFEKRRLGELITAFNYLKHGNWYLLNLVGHQITEQEASPPQQPIVELGGGKRSLIAKPRNTSGKTRTAGLPLAKP